MALAHQLAAVQHRRGFQSIWPNVSPTKEQATGKTHTGPKRRYPIMALVIPHSKMILLKTAQI